MLHYPIEKIKELIKEKEKELSSNNNYERKNRAWDIENEIKQLTLALLVLEHHSSMIDILKNHFEDRVL